MSRSMTRRHQRCQCRLRARVLEAQQLPEPRRVAALRCAARHCLHLGLRELAQEARQMARAGGAA
jgi:hypothetical protein